MPREDEWLDGEPLKRSEPMISWSGREAQPTREKFHPLTPDEQELFNCATDGCDERPRWMRIYRNGGSWSTVCDACKARIEGGA